MHANAVNIRWIAASGTSYQVQHYTKVVDSGCTVHATGGTENPLHNLRNRALVEQ